MHGARRKSAASGPVEDDRLDHDPQLRVVDLAREVLEKALELFGRAVRGRQELGRVEAARLDPAGVVNLDHELASKALDPAADRDGVAGLEAKADPVGVAKRAGGDRPAAIAQAQGQVRGAVARRLALLRDHGVAALETLSGAQLGDLRMDLGDGRFHPPIVNFGADTKGQQPAHRSERTE